LKGLLADFSVISAVSVFKAKMAFTAYRLSTYDNRLVDLREKFSLLQTYGQIQWKENMINAFLKLANEAKWLKL